MLDLIVAVGVACDRADAAGWLESPERYAAALLPERPASNVPPERAAATSTSEALNLQDLREVRFERVEWFWKNLIPFAELILVNGAGGIGKTTFLLDLVARSSAGLPMPGGLQHDPMPWLLISEEDRHGILRARLNVAGANLENIRHVKSVGEEDDYLTFPRHVRALRDTIVAEGFKGVMIDALFSHIDDDVNPSRPQEMRNKVAGPLSDVAHETGAIILAIRHISKSGSGGRASERGYGSSEGTNVARSELTVGPLQDDEGQSRLFVIALSKETSRRIAPPRRPTASSPQRSSMTSGSRRRSRASHGNLPHRRSPQTIC